MTSKTSIKWSKTITPSLINQLIRSEKDIQKAKLIFNSATLDKSSGYQHDHTTYTLMISRLASANQFKEAEELLNRMKHEKCSLNEDIFLSIFRAYGRVRRPTDVLRVFRMMKELGCDPSEKSYMTVFDILVTQSQLKMAQKFYKFMKDVGVKPSTTIINILLKALCMDEGTVDAAIRVFEQMSRLKCTPDGYTYGTLINGLCKFGMVNEAVKLFEEMEAKGCSPTVVTYTSLINGLCRSKKLDEAMGLLEKMCSKGVEPNVFTFSSLMDGLCKVGSSSQAMELFEKMIRTRHKPNMITYSTLINGLCKDGNLQGAVELFDRMKLQGLKPDVGLYGKLISGFCDSSRFQEAANFLDEMVLDGLAPNRLTWTLNVNLHNMVVRGLCSGNSLNRAFQVYLSMRTRGISVHVETFNTLVDCTCKKGDMHKAAKIVREMVLDGCIPDEKTWTVALGGLGSRRKAQEAADLLQNELMGECMETKMDELRRESTEAVL